MQIFISYAREDFDLAEDLYSYIKFHGFSPWMDKKDLIGGMNWEKVLEEEISKSDAVIFLFSENILSFLKNCCVEPSYRSDHSRIILELELNPFIRGKGLWKFNNSLLYDADYVNAIKEKILDVKKQYAALAYNFDNINEVNNDDLHFTINSQLFLETLLMEVRG